MIPEEMQQELFNKFQIVGTIDDRKTGGLGLGLFIAYQLTEAHEGTLSFESQVDQGSTFKISLPIRA